MSGDVAVQVLGGLRCLVGGNEVSIGGERRRQVLARLALAAPEFVTPEALVDAVWGRGAGAKAKSTLHVHLSTLRAALREAGASTVVVTGEQGYRLAVPADAVDVHRFERLVGEGVRAVVAGRYLPGRADLADAIDLWAEPFPELVADEEATAERHRLGLVLERAQDHLVDAELGLGRASDVVDELERRVEVAPWRERSVEQLVRAHAALGRRDAAALAYDRACARMRAEFDLEPSERLRAAAGHLIASDASGGTAAGPQQAIVDDIVERLRPAGASVVVVAATAAARAALVADVCLRVQHDLRRTLVVRTSASDRSPFEPVDRAVWPLLDVEGRPEHPGAANEALVQRVGPGGVVVLADLHLAGDSMLAFADQLIGRAGELGIAVVAFAAEPVTAIAFGSTIPVDDMAPARPSGELAARLEPVLTAAALAGPEFPVELMIRLPSLGGHRVLADLDEARRRRLIEDGADGHFRIADAAIELLDVSTPRPALHLEIAAAAAATWSISGPRRRTLVAWHLGAALPDGDLTPAADAVVVAVDDLLASDLYRDALVLLRALEPYCAELEASDRALAGVLIDRLARCHVRGGRLDDGERWARELIAFGRRHDDTERFAEGVRLLGERTSPQRHGAELMALQREAITRIGEPPTDASVQLLTDLAGAHYERDLAEARRLADEAVATADRVGRRDTVARAMTGKLQSLLRPTDADGRLALAIDAQAVARRADRPELQVLALTYEIYTLFELGRIGAVGPPLRYAEELVRDMQFGRVRWWVEAWSALHDIATGRPERGESRAHAALERWSDPDSGDAYECYVSQLVTMRLLSGDGAAVAPILVGLAEAAPDRVGYRGVAALALAQSGDLAAANAHLDAVAGRGIDALRDDATFTTSAALLAESAWVCGRADVAELLHPRLEPLADRHAVLNMWGGGGMYWGSLRHSLGLLDALRGDTARAAEQLAAAATSARQDGTTPFAERAESALATLR
ncbi:MAG: BTAD domain-containing putative transcriptional regulator [Ilumatobacter sp.]|uniref:BTAD domain-containing putative transcriptional regulator n=1 Tax=Ilumatobacter sp. TaxID=1967498 RepID=UPI00261EE946|nr:BTAD domain-containing putative transcriptional regulator [Ilumatobacter sp.]MDJ0767224.1 BTAD domain-containing putative transcriptional regulator [Ilumatobacter sp.]